MLNEYFPLLLLIGYALVIGFGLTLLAYLLGPKKTSPQKSLAFESGLVAKGSNKKQQTVRFYLIAMVFLIFDVEVILLYPYAVIFRELGWAGLGMIGFFLGFLGLGLLYEWRKGALEWE